MYSELESKQIRVMIVNDSLYMTRVISDILSTPNQIELMATASDGVDALKKIERDEPDVILLDLEMPNMDGLTFIEKMTQRSKIIPIIVVSNYTNDDSKLVLDSLEFGAVDFLPLSEVKPDQLPTFKAKLISKIKNAAKSDPYDLITKNICDLRPTEKNTPVTDSANIVVIIGASTGGPEIVKKIIEHLPENLNAGVIIIQHMQKVFLESFAKRLERIAQLKVNLAQSGDVIKTGEILVAPGDYHLLIGDDHRVILDDGEKRFGVRPAINMTMVTGSEVFGNNVVGVILTGMGHDGGFGMRSIKKRGGYTIVQTENTCEKFGMPRSVIQQNIVDKILPPEKIAAEIIVGVNERVRK